MILEYITIYAPHIDTSSILASLNNRCDKPIWS